MSRKLAVVAIGGNALISTPEKMSVYDQAELVKNICSNIVDIIRSGWRVVITHGNGPQVGMIMRRSELALDEVPPLPLDYAGADLQGGIGYMFVKALRNEFQAKGIVADVAALLTQVLVNKNDPAFSNPTKPIGSWMEEKIAKSFAKDLGWTVAEDSGRGWRRMVPSPSPISILDLSAITHLIAEDVVVIACGGGGIPVVERENGEIEGVEAVIDKDFSSSLLAKQLQADALILVTSVDRVAFDFNSPKQRFIDTLTLTEARQACADGQFAKGSMLPKVQALIDFVEHGGTGIITSVHNLAPSLKGESGTRIVAKNT